jgi:hypothetical protein
MKRAIDILNNKDSDGSKKKKRASDFLKGKSEVETTQEPAQTEEPKRGTLKAFQE